jgi:hypothetical protein
MSRVFIPAGLYWQTKLLDGTLEIMWFFMPSGNKILRSSFPEARKAFFTWLLVAAGTLAPLAWAWFHGLTLVQRDNAGIYAPLRWLAGQAVRGGRLPLWNPYCATGMPFLGETIHGILHPVSIAVAFLFPGDSIDPLLGGYVLAGGIGAGIFARVLGASPRAGVLASFAYGLSGYTLSMTGNLVYLAGAATVPWILAGLRAVGSRATVLSFILAACSVASGAFSGDMQMLLVTTVTGLVLALEGGGARGLVTALCAAIIGIFLAGIQLAPSWDFLHLTNRMLDLADYDVNQWDLAPWRMLEFFSPGFFWHPGDGWHLAPVYMALVDATWFNIPFSESVYIGTATILLAFAGVRSSRTSRILTVSAVVILWLSMGKYLGARAVQNIFPIIKGFRYGEKYLPVFLSCIAMLAALGADRLVQETSLARRNALTALVAAALFLAGWMYLLLFPEAFKGMAEVRMHLLQGLPHAFGAGFALAACCLAAARGRVSLSMTGMVAVIWICGFAASSYALRPGRPEARLTAPPPLVSAPEPGPRIFNISNPAPRLPRRGWDSIDELDFGVLSTLGANTNARFRIDNFSVDTGLYPIRWFRLNETMGSKISVAVRRYGVTCLVFPQPETDWGKAEAARITENGTHLLTDSRNGMEFWNIPHRPWASFPDKVVSVQNLDDALAYVRNTIDTGGTETVVESSNELPAANGSVLSISRGLERLELVAETAADATLVVNDAYWPGWRANIDGKEATILPADALVRAVYWPAGRHTLVMEYKPSNLQRGKWLSLAGVGALAGGCLLLRKRCRSSKMMSHDKS